jgi:predicted GH43/DUF377 family glycosyl hydrolase
MPITTALPRFDATVQRKGVVMQPDGDPNEIEGVLNPACVRTRDGALLLYPRCVARGNVSRVGLALGHAAADRVTFQRLGYALEPVEPYERREQPGGMGCEDPRVTFVPVLDRFVMVYTAFGPAGPRITVALSDDGYAWTRLGQVDFTAHGLPTGDDKDGAFFPEPVVSPAGVRSLAFYHRPMKKISATNGHAAVPMLLAMPPAERECTCIAYVPLESVLADIGNLLRPTESVIVLAPDGAWGRLKTGGGTPPVRVAEGWFSLYHAVDAAEVADGKYAMTYSAGIVVHDHERPHIVRYRSSAPVLAPQSVDELHGVVNNVVFPTGIDVLGDRVFDIYYGAADARIARARMELAPPASASADADENAA